MMEKILILTYPQTHRLPAISIADTICMEGDKSQAEILYGDVIGPEARDVS